MMRSEGDFTEIFYEDQLSYLLFVPKGFTTPIAISMKKVKQVLKNIEPQSIPLGLSYIQGYYTYLGNVVLLVSLKDLLEFQAMRKYIDPLSEQEKSVDKNYLHISDKGKDIILTDVIIKGEITEDQLVNYRDITSYSNKSILDSSIVYRKDRKHLFALQINFETLMEVLTRDLRDDSQSMISKSNSVLYNSELETIEYNFKSIDEINSNSINDLSFQLSPSQYVADAGEEDLAHDLIFRIGGYNFTVNQKDIIALEHNTELDLQGDLFHPYSKGVSRVKNRNAVIYSPRHFLTSIKENDTEEVEDYQYRLIFKNEVDQVYWGFFIESIAEAKLAVERKFSSSLVYPICSSQIESIFKSVSWYQGRPLFHLDLKILYDALKEKDVKFWEFPSNTPFKFNEVIDSNEQKDSHYQKQFFEMNFDNHKLWLFEENKQTSLGINRLNLETLLISTPYIENPSKDSVILGWVKFNGTPVPITKRYSSKYWDSEINSKIHNSLENNNVNLAIIKVDEESYTVSNKLNIKYFGLVLPKDQIFEEIYVENKIDPKIFQWLKTTFMNNDSVIRIGSISPFEELDENALLLEIDEIKILDQINEALIKEFKSNKDLQDIVDNLEESNYSVNLVDYLGAEDDYSGYVIFKDSSNDLIGLQLNDFVEYIGNPEKLKTSNVFFDVENQRLSYTLERKTTISKLQDLETFSFEAFFKETKELVDSSEDQNRYHLLVKDQDEFSILSFPSEIDLQFFPVSLEQKLKGAKKNSSIPKLYRSFSDRILQIPTYYEEGSGKNLIIVDLKKMLSRSSRDKSKKNKGE